MRSTRWASLLASGLLVTSGIPAAAAAGPRPALAEGAVTAAVGSPVTVLSPGCTFDEASADAVAESATSVNKSRGFVSFGGGDCPRPAFAGRLSYFSGAGGSWFRQTSPYSGSVMAVADDNTGTWVLFSKVDGVFVGKRRLDGTFTTAVPLSTAGSGGATLPTGDLIARGGRYWAVWSEQVGPGGEFAPIDLFQAKTLGTGSCAGPATRQRLTFHMRDDVSPSLALVPLSSGRTGAHLTWSRNDSAVGESGWIMFSRAGCDGDWSTFQTLATAGNNLEPDLTRAGSTDYLAWAHNARIVEAQISTTYSAIGFSTPVALAPHIDVSGSTVFILASSGQRLGTRERRGGVWSTRWLTSPGLQQQAVSVTHFGSAFTAFGISFSSHRLYAIRVTP